MKNLTASSLILVLQSFLVPGKAILQLELWALLGKLTNVHLRLLEIMLWLFGPLYIIEYVCHANLKRVIFISCSTFI
jgi:hypothetical protein